MTQRNEYQQLIIDEIQTKRDQAVERFDANDIDGITDAFYRGIAQAHLRGDHTNGNGYPITKQSWIPWTNICPICERNTQ